MNLAPDVLLSRMDNELGISQSPMESKQEWTGRLLLSACSAWFLEGLSNTTSKGISISHIKKKLTEKASSYLEIFHQDIKNHDELSSTIAEYIYNTHLVCSSFYHKSYQVLRAQELTRTCFSVKMCRCPYHPHGHFFSGLGAYNVAPNQSRSGDLEQLFADYHLPQQRPGELLERICSNRKWQPYTEGEYREFLNIHRKSGESYYTSKHPESDGILPARESNEFGYRYLLTTKESISELQTWEQEEWFHQYAALAVMCTRQTQMANVVSDGKLARLSLDYALPLPEENFLRMYAWPKSLNQLSDRWNFWIAAPVYPLFRARLRHLGFDITEVPYE